MIDSMERKPFLRAPKVYKTHGIKEGDKVAVHILKENQKFLQLSFKEQTGTSSFDSEATLDSELNDYKDDKDISILLDQIEEKILSMGNLYSSYNYLFTVSNKKIFLMSVTISNLALGFEAVKDIANKIEVEFVKPSWTGTYTTTTCAAFYEDIFIQSI